MTTAPPSAGSTKVDAHALRMLTASAARPLLGAAVISAAAGSLWIGQAYVLSQVIAALVEARLASSEAVEACAVFVGLSALRCSLDLVAGIWGQAASEWLQLSIRTRLLARVAQASPLDANRPHPGEIAAAVTTYVEALSPYLLRYQPARMRLMIVPAGILCAVAVVSWLAAANLLLTAPVIPIFMALIGSRAREVSLQHLKQIGSLNGYVLDRLQNLTTLNLFNAVEATAGNLGAFAEGLRRKTMSVLRIAFLSSAVLELFAALGVASIAVYVGFSLLGQISVGTTAAALTLASGLFVLLLAPEFFQPFREFAAAYHDRAGALAAAREITVLLGVPCTRLPGQDAAMPGSERSKHMPVKIVLKGVGLQLDPTRQAIFRDISLTIEAGEHVALVGPSGCGKTMLLGLIAGLVAATSGTIAVDGLSLSDATVERWRRRVAWLSQKPVFVHGSVQHNLRLGRSGLSSASLEGAIDAVGLRDVVLRLPRGLATVLSETGAGVSGGEAQRLALARAVMADAPVIMADEPTEHLDDVTAQIVADALLVHARHRTLVVATHDERLIRRMHRVIDVSRLERVVSPVPYIEAAE